MLRLWSLLETKVEHLRSLSQQGEVVESSGLSLIARDSPRRTKSEGSLSEQNGDRSGAQPPRIGESDAPSLHDKNEVWLVGPLGFEPRTDRLKVTSSSFKTSGKLQGNFRSQATSRPKAHTRAKVAIVRALAATKYVRGPLTRTPASS